MALNHFQSHYLPAGRPDRVRSLGRFGKLDVFLVDVYDVLLSKLFSDRNKDLGCFSRSAGGRMTSRHRIQGIRWAKLKSESDPPTTAGG